MLSPRSATLISASLPAVGANIETISARFYERMFAAIPELQRDLFNRGNQARGDQQRALAGSIVRYAQHLVDPQAPSVERLIGRVTSKHASLGIVESQYTIVHEHLFAAIAEVLGDALTPDIAAAWDEVYWMMASEFMGVERRLYAQARVEPGQVWGERLIVERVEAAEDTVSFVLESGEDEPLPAFLPGQFISVQIPVADGARQIRQYSLSSSPQERGRWRVTLRYITPTQGSHASYLPGEVTNRIIDTIHVGDTLRTSLPFGDVTMAPAGQPLVLISAGAGITPVLGMLHAMQDADDNRELLLLHSERTPERVAHLEEFEELVAALPGATAELWFTDNRPSDARHLQVDASEVPEDAAIIICGPVPFMASVRGQLVDGGIAPERITTETFGPEPDPLRDTAATGPAQLGRHGQPTAAAEQLSER